MINRSLHKTYADHVINSADRILDNTRRITQYLVVDSASRNKIRYPQPNQYEYILPTPYKDIISIELISIYLPLSGYTINNSNNQLTFWIDSSLNSHTLTVPPGNYVMDSSNTSFNNHNLDSMITTILDTIDPSYNLECSYNYNKSKFYFKTTDSSLHVYNIDFLGGFNSITKDDYGNKLSSPIPQPIYKTRSIGRKIGFEPQIYDNTVDLSNISIASIGVNLWDITIQGNDIAYILELFYLNDSDWKLLINFTYSLEIVYNEIEYAEITNNQLKLRINKILNPLLIGSWSINDSRTNFIIADCVSDVEDEKYLYLEIKELDRYDARDKIASNSFAIIPFSPFYQTFDTVKSYGNCIEFNPPLSRLEKLSITFRNYDGEIYDFNCKNHNFVLAIETLNTNMAIA